MSNLEESVLEALHTVYDPEIPMDIYEIGLIYKVDINDQGRVHIDMTLTSPMCPVAESLPVDVEHAVNKVEGVTSTVVDVVWEPPWDPEMMSEAAKLELGFF